MIDWRRVEELRDEIGADGFVEIADMFLEEAEGAVSELLAGLPDDKVEGKLHFLKGSALNLGLTDLAAICSDGERRAAAGQGGVDAAQVAEVYRASRTQLLRRLNQASAA
jgi:HPt (histidine-containing phosphotransfer) domain-containing protein